MHRVYSRTPPRNWIFLFYDEIDLSQRISVQITSKLVRSKALDVFFTKIKKLSILPQSPLIPEGIEEGLRTDWGKFLKISFLNASSILTEMKRHWGRVRNFLIFIKYSSRAFKRTFSEVIWTKIRWERYFWNFEKFSKITIFKFFMDFWWNFSNFFKNPFFPNFQKYRSQRVFV